MVCLAAVVGLILGCGAEQFKGAGPRDNPGSPGSGGAGPDIDGGAVTTGTGGSGSGGDDGTGGDNTGTGGLGTEGDGGSRLDSALDLPPLADSGGDDAATDSAADLPRPVDTHEAGRASPDAGACLGGAARDLSNVGTGDFRISFHVVTTQMGWAALLNQRSTCFLGLFWDIRQTATGTILVETDANTNPSYQTVESTIKINDGQPHDVAVARVGGLLTIRIDGAAAGQGPSSGALGTLPAVKVGDDACGATSNPATAKFAGMTLSEVCITRG
jgi:hypothetical protein